MRAPMTRVARRFPRIPPAPRSIQKGVPLKHLLDTEAVDCLAEHISFVYRDSEAALFRRTALNGLEPLGLMQRAQHIAKALHQHVPGTYRQAIALILKSLTAAERSDRIRRRRSSPPRERQR